MKHASLLPTNRTATGSGTVACETNVARKRFQSCLHHWKLFELQLTSCLYATSNSMQPLCNFELQNIHIQCRSKGHIDLPTICVNELGALMDCALCVVRSQNKARERCNATHTNGKMQQMKHVFWKPATLPPASVQAPPGAPATTHTRVHRLSKFHGGRHASLEARSSVSMALTEGCHAEPNIYDQTRTANTSATNAKNNVLASLTAHQV